MGMATQGVQHGMVVPDAQVDVDRIVLMIVCFPPPGCRQRCAAEPGQTLFGEVWEEVQELYEAAPDLRSTR